MTTSDGSSAATTPTTAKPRKQFRLTGPSVPVDRRRHAVRRDLADIACAEQIFAQHYAVPLPRTVTRKVDVLQKPQASTEVVGCIGAGDSFEVLDIGSQWAWGQCAAVGCVGYIPVDALA